MWLLAEPTTELKQPGVPKDEGPMVNPRSEILFSLTCMHMCVCILACLPECVQACVCQVEVSLRCPSLFFETGPSVLELLQ